MTIHAYAKQLDIAALRSPGGAIYWPKDNTAAMYVLLLAGHYLSLGEWSEGLLLECANHMLPSEAIELAQTLIGIARRGAALGTRPEGGL